MVDKFILKGVFTQFDYKNRNNGRIYPVENYLTLIKPFIRKSKIKNILNV